MEFFHVTHGSDSEFLNVGKEVVISKNRLNHFYENTMNGANSFGLSENESMPIIKFFDSILLGELDSHSEFKNYKNIASYAKAFMEIYIKQVRELHFESIRKEEFSSLPSRKHCIWLAKNHDDAYYWVKRLGGGKENKRIIRIKILDGVPFETNEGHLQYDSEPTTKILERARQYWKGEPSDGRNEFLFEGKFKILEILRTQ
ncbi:DUF2441 domain-containing protein [Klebsiella michiganensis]|uniref:DUF2441 domain-containing protein n=1 Tax=Klebsiella michiganensis TaxID=1134687 RepID=UPI0038844A5C